MQSDAGLLEKSGEHITQSDAGLLEESGGLLSAGPLACCAVTLH